MQKPKHIRTKLKAKVEAIVSTNKADMPNLKATTHAIHSRTVDGKGFSTGFRASPSPTISHRFSIHPGRDFFTHNSDQVLTAKQRRSKYRVRDSELYNNKLVPNKLDNRCMVKVGVTPARTLILEDKETGETYKVKLPKQDKWKEVGKP